MLVCYTTLSWMNAVYLLFCNSFMFLRRDHVEEMGKQLRLIQFVKSGDFYCIFFLCKLFPSPQLNKLCDNPLCDL